MNLPPNTHKLKDTGTRKETRWNLQWSQREMDINATESWKTHRVASQDSLECIYLVPSWSKKLIHRNGILGIWERWYPIAPYPPWMNILCVLTQFPWVRTNVNGQVSTFETYQPVPILNLFFNYIPARYHWYWIFFKYSIPACYWYCIFF
jgi:hypothetical protein